VDIFVARQPIFNRDNVVVGYELLYRDSEKNFYNTSITYNVATAILLMNSYFHFGINNLVGDKTAFINFDEYLIKAEIPNLLSTTNVVIELLENITPDEVFVSKIQKLINEGYTIAIDDFDGNYSHEELIRLSRIIKVDFLKNSKDDIQQIFYKYHKQGKLLLAEKVETREQYEWAKKLGFDYFQGYFFKKPGMLRSKELSVSSAQYIRLMEALTKPEPNFKDIANIIEIDVRLTYKLLRVVNSSFSLATHITSIHHALSILGINAFSKWLSLAMVQDLGKVTSTELIKLSMFRSKFLELIASQTPILENCTDEISLLGILSVIDVLLHEPMVKIVKNLPLTEAVKKAFLGEESVYSIPYKLCLEYEKGNFGNMQALCDSIQYNINKLPHDYQTAIEWSDKLWEYMENEQDESLRHIK